MIRLARSLSAWGSLEFAAVLKQELEQQADGLPLQQGLSASSSVADAPVTAVIHNVAETENAIRIKAGIFYQGLLGGCSCADDPGPPGENNEYCELLLEIDKTTAMASVVLQEG